MILALQAKYLESVFVVTGMQLVLYFFLGAHWCACVFFSITYGLGDPHSDDPYVRHLFNDGWSRSDGVLDENGKHVQYTADPWLSSMYWAVTTMFTIDYGDIRCTLYTHCFIVPHVFVLVYVFVGYVVCLVYPGICRLLEIHALVRLHTHASTLAHTRTHACTHTHTYTYTHTHTHTHTHQDNDNDMS